MFAFEIGKIPLKIQSFFPISTRDRNEFLSEFSRFPRQNDFLDRLKPRRESAGAFSQHHMSLYQGPVRSRHQAGKFRKPLESPEAFSFQADASVDQMPLVCGLSRMPFPSLP